MTRHEVLRAWLEANAPTATTNPADAATIAAAAAYNAATTSVSTPLVSLTALLEWGAAGPFGALETAATSFTNSSATTQALVRSACAAAEQLFTVAGATFDLSDQSNQNMIALLVSQGVWTQDQASALNALGISNVPLYKQPEQFGTPVTVFDVAAALA